MPKVNLVGMGASLSVTRSTITENKAIGGEGEDDGKDGKGVGGGVYNLGKFTFDVATVIRQNHASTSNDDIFRGFWASGDSSRK